MTYAKKFFAPVLILSLCASAYKGSAQSTVRETYIPDYAKAILQQDSLVGGLSDRALNVLSRPVTVLPSYMTSADTSFYTPLFAPLIFDIDKMRRFDYPSQAFLDSLDLRKKNPFKVRPTLEEALWSSTREQLFGQGVLGEEMRSWRLVQSLRHDQMLRHVDETHMTTAMLPKDRIEYHNIEAAEYDGRLAINEVSASPATPDLELKTIERVYWQYHFESNIHFSQNKISENWYRGGRNSINLNMRNRASANYERERIKWVNELETKLGFFSSPDDPINKLKISDDIFRLNSNFGVKAFENWYYTLDGQFRTQMMLNRDKEGRVVTRTFAPILVDLGVGMKYEMDKRFKDDAFKRLRFSINASPAALSFMYTYSDDIDKGRIGLEEDERFKLRFGSTFRFMLDYDMSQTFNWRSRFLYITSYKHIETEFENTFSYAMTRYLTVALNLNVRFDDSVIVDDDSFKNMVQYNQLFSLGFTFKI